MHAGQPGERLRPSAIVHGSNRGTGEHERREEVPRLARPYWAGGGEAAAELFDPGAWLPLLALEAGTDSEDHAADDVSGDAVGGHESAGVDLMAYMDGACGDPRSGLLLGRRVEKRRHDVHRAAAERPGRFTVANGDDLGWRDAPLCKACDQLIGQPAGRRRSGESPAGQVGGANNVRLGGHDAGQRAALVYHRDESRTQLGAPLPAGEEVVGDTGQAEVGPAGGHPEGVGGPTTLRRLEYLDGEAMIGEQTVRNRPEEGEVNARKSAGAVQAQTDVVERSRHCVQCTGAQRTWRAEPCSRNPSTPSFMANSQ